MDIPKQGTLTCSSRELDLGVTLNGGQSFRWATCNSGYRGVFGSSLWTLSQTEENISYVMHSSLRNDEDLNGVLSQYFRLDVSLEDQCKSWAESDKYFYKSNAKVNGVRILNQDIVENLFSFICSSNNNIQRISGMVEKLCSLFGKKICTLDGHEYYDFPTIESLCEEDVQSILRNEGFGYRAGYIAKTARQLLELGGRQWLLGLHKDANTSYALARERLTAFSGVGPKVADCVCLMSLGHLEAIPVDTHIFQVAQANYLPHLAKRKTVTPKIHEEVSSHLRTLWGPLAGWAQAIVFCAKINPSTVPFALAKRKNKENDASHKENRKRNNIVL